MERHVLIKYLVIAAFFIIAAVWTSCNKNEEKPKSVAVGEQNGTLTASVSGMVTFAVTTENIADGWYDAIVANCPTGVYIHGNVFINDNSGTLTLAGYTATIEGVATTLTLTIDETTSAFFTLVILPAPPKLTLSVEPYALSFAAAGEQKLFAVTSNVEWTISGKPAWLALSAASGNGNATVTVTAIENPYYESRAASLRIRSTNVENAYLEITQAALVADIELSLSVAPASLTFAPALEAKSFEITSNTNWMITGIPAWLALSAASGNGNATVTVTAIENTAYTNRTATLTITIADLSYATVSIMQTAL